MKKRCAKGLIGPKRLCSPVIKWSCSCIANLSTIQIVYNTSMEIFQERSISRKVLRSYGDVPSILYILPRHRRLNELSMEKNHTLLFGMAVAKHHPVFEILYSLKIFKIFIYLKKVYFF